MLNNRNLDDRTYEELMAEALLQIPLYSGEWTNFNPSDPGITILENLTAFEALQQNYINQVTPAIVQNLLKLAGFQAEKGRCARVLLAAENVKEPVRLPANQKFYLGDLCFETNRNLELKTCRLTGIYGVRDGESHDCSHLLDREVRVPAHIFGKAPKAGDSLWITADALPEPGGELIFYVTVADRYNRNPFLEKGNNTFAAMKWECYTQEGFVEMNVRDYTGCFLVSGEIRMRLPDTIACPCPEVPGGGYAIRATLLRAEYDVRPRLTAVDGFLFEAWQKDTRCVCHTFNKVSGAALSGDLIREGYAAVFCKEGKGSSYKKYVSEHTRRGDEQGRFYQEEEAEDGSRIWRFDRRLFGYGPEKVKNAIKIVVYSEEIMRRYALGTVLGNDRQEIRLPVQHIVPESFCIIAKRLDDCGEEIYDFVRPGRYGEDDLTYSLYEDEGKIVIEDAGDYIGASLFMGTVSLTRGSEGNIRAGSRLTAAGLSPGLRFYNPTPGTGGCLKETLEDVRKRFLQDLKTPYTAVTAGDYEKLVQRTPELCIHKVKAYMNESRNMVRIAVKPGTDEEFPKLPDTYRRVIEKQLENKRLLTTRIEIVAPVYTPIDVHGTVYVKRQYENSLEMIEEAIREQLDYIHSRRNFGDVLKFDEVFHGIEALDCVDFVYELSLHPRNPALAKLVEADIVPNENCLCYAGNIVLQKF